MTYHIGVDCRILKSGEVLGYVLIGRYMPTGCVLGLIKIAGWFKCQGYDIYHLGIKRVHWIYQTEHSKILVEAGFWEKSCTE